MHEPSMHERDQWLTAARDAIYTEATALSRAAARLDGEILRACDAILAHPGKILVSGIGKSGHIARKIAATLCATGTPAVFLHPAEAAHGDLGVCQAGDPAILVSKNGASPELAAIVPALRRNGSPLIGILGNPSSGLRAQVDVFLDASVEREADPQNLVPTASAVVALAIGDALASALMRARSFTGDQFGKYHPGGQLGRNLLLTVGEAMLTGDRVATVSIGATLKEVIIAMTQRPSGGACVVDATGGLAGFITDGDVRRALTNHDDIRELNAEDVMTRRPISIHPEATLNEALETMERRPSQISILPVVDGEMRLRGVIRIHDIYLGSR